MPIEAPPFQPCTPQELKLANDVLHSLASYATQKGDPTTFHIMCAAARIVHGEYMAEKFGKQKHSLIRSDD